MKNEYMHSHFHGPGGRPRVCDREFHGLPDGQIRLVVCVSGGLEHAIAMLIGKAPADFSIPAAPIVSTQPQIPTGIPSAILERRPDVASAERKMAAANAQIGVAKAAPTFHR